jgi:ABC-type polysaccharide/polyol phosphate export permease
MNLDIIGQILWYSIPFTPVITIPIIWLTFKRKWYIKILIGLLFALILSAILYGLSLSIIFRDGMGPT